MLKWLTQFMVIGQSANVSINKKINVHCKFGFHLGKISGKSYIHMQMCMYSSELHYMRIIEFMSILFGFTESTSNHSMMMNNAEVMKRHYKQLQKEMDKKKPNAHVVNSYLNKQFQARRE
jgi:hypothetical protein